MTYLAQHFDPTNEFNILRIICDLFLLPHLAMKLKDLAGTYELYRAWRLYPPKAWVHACIAIEIVGSIGLVFAIYTPHVAAPVAVFMFVASWAGWRVSNGKWLWNTGGFEYPLFWAICCVVLAMHG